MSLPIAQLEASMAELQYFLEMSSSFYYFHY